METKLQELKDRLREAHDINASVAVLSWDQTTYMPPGGAAARGRQMAVLGRLAHERFTDPAIGHLLDALRPHEESLPYDADDAALIRVTRREYERATRVPAAFVAELNAHQAESYQVWAEARPANDFAAVRPYLEKTLALSRQYADFFPGYAHIADPLIDVADYGMTAGTIQPLFAALRARSCPSSKPSRRSRPPTTLACVSVTPMRRNGQPASTSPG